jgi:hypothetical protein
MTVVASHRCPGRVASDQPRPSAEGIRSCREVIAGYGWSDVEGAAPQGVG